MSGIGVQIGIGRRQRRKTAVTPAIQSALRTVFMRQTGNGNPVALTGGRNIVLTRVQMHTGHQTWASLRFRFGSWFHTLNSVTINKEQAGPQGVTIVGAAFERGTFQVAPITFNGGQRSVTLGPDEDVVSDPFLPSAWSGQTVIAANTQFWVRLAVDVGTDGQFVARANLASGVSESALLALSADPVTVRTAVDQNGALTAALLPSGTITTNGLVPINVVGTPATPLEPDMGIIAQGSSFVEGAGDSGYTGLATSGGFVLRGTASVGTPTARRIPITNYARSSGMWAEIAQSNTRRERAWPHARILVLDGPTNDCATVTTLTQIMAHWDTIRARADAHGLFKIVTLVAPRCTGTYGSDATQTPVTNFTTGGKRDQINAALIARWQAGEIGYLIDPNLGRIGLRDRTTWVDLDGGANTHRLQSITVPDRWYSDAVPTTVTTDGVHPNATGHARMALLLDWVLEDIRANYGTIFA